MQQALRKFIKSSNRLNKQEVQRLQAFAFVS